MCKNAPCEDVHTKFWRCMCTDALLEDVQSAGDACMEVHVYICRCMYEGACVHRGCMYGGACVKKHCVKTYI